MEQQVEIRKNITQFKSRVKEICVLIAEARRASGQTQKDVAEWVGVSLRTYLELEKGNCTIDLLCDLADKFDIQINLTFN